MEWPFSALRSFLLKGRKGLRQGVGKPELCFWAGSSPRGSPWGGGRSRQEQERVLPSCSRGEVPEAAHPGPSPLCPRGERSFSGRRQLGLLHAWPPACLTPWLLPPSCPLSSLPLLAFLKMGLGRPGEAAGLAKDTQLSLGLDPQPPASYQEHRPQSLTWVPGPSSVPGCGHTPAIRMWRVL